MANFDDQVMGITGLTISGSSTAPSQTELSTFLNDGVIDVTNKSIQTTPQEAENFSRESAEQTSNGFDPGSSKIISVVRESGTNGEWYPCIKKTTGLQYKVTDVNSLEYASKYNPVYMIFENRNIHVFPEPGSSNDGFKVLYINYSPEETDGTALQHSSSGIKWFPKDKVYLVVLYASIKSLQCSLADLESSSDITNVLALANTELDDTRAVCDDISTNLDSAIVQNAEAATQVDASIDTALAAMVTAAGRINTAVALGNAEFDLAHLNNELNLLNRKKIDTKNIIDTLELAKEKFPGS